MNLLNYTFPFKIKKIHNYDFLNLGKKQARLFISNNLKNYSKDDMNYLISRFIIFFSQIIFDKTLIISLIKLYNPEKVLIFEEKIHSIIIKGWNINRGFFYYQSIIKIFFPKIKIDFYKIKNQKYKNFVLKIYNILNTNNVVKNLINSLNIIINKNLIILEGLRGDKLLKKKITKNFKQRNYTIITEFKNSIFIRLLYYFYKKKKLYNIRNNQNKKKIFGLGYLNLKIEIDSMTTFMSNYFKYQKFLINKFKKKKILFGLFQEKSDINIALKKSNIKTFQLPHGAIVTPELSPMVASYNFISNLNQKIYYQRSKMLTGKSYVSGVPHINSNINNVRKSFKKIIIFMKNMGMRRWEFDDYDKILEIISFISKYAKKNNHNVILKFHPSGGRFQYQYLKDSQYFKRKKIKLLLNYDTNNLISENEIFICLQESSVINQIIGLNKKIIFPLIHLNENYLKNHMYREIEKTFFIPKSFAEIGKYIDDIKKEKINKSYDHSNFKTYFGNHSIKRINNFILNKEFIR